jgi:hypothetical protein
LSKSRPDDREERHVQAMTDSLRRALQDGTAEQHIERLAGAAMGDEAGAGARPQPARIVELFRSWHEAERRYRDAPGGSPEVQELLEEVNRRWAAYEAAVNKVDGEDSLGGLRQSE